MSGKIIVAIVEGSACAFGGLALIGHWFESEQHFNWLVFVFSGLCFGLGFLQALGRGKS